MTDTDWRERFDELRKQGFKSPRMDALERKFVPRTHEQAHSAIERELRAEMASSLGRAEEKLLAELLELDVLDQALARSPGPTLVAEFNGRRDRVKRALYEYIVTREAVGLRNHELIHTLYPIPPERG